MPFYIVYGNAEEPFVVPYCLTDIIGQDNIQKKCHRIANILYIRQYSRTLCQAVMTSHIMAKCDLQKKQSNCHFTLYTYGNVVEHFAEPWLKNENAIDFPFYRMHGNAAEHFNLP